MKTARERIEANELACLEIFRLTHEANPTKYNAQQTQGFTFGTYTPQVERIVKKVCEKYKVSKEGIELIILKK